MWLIIGVSGATCSGKSSLAHSLEKALPGSTLICQDDFFLPEGSEKHIWIPSMNDNNWEIMSSLDMDKMHETINKILSCESPKVTSLQTLEKLATNITSNTEKETYIEKSATITYTTTNMNVECPSAENIEINPENTKSSKINILIVEGFLIFNDKKLADLCNMKYFLSLERDVCLARRKVRTYNSPEAPGYFDQCVWPEYVKNRDQVFQEVSDVKVFDGTTTRSSILNQVLQDIVKRAMDVINKSNG